jgi:hypothetical protein
VGKEEVHMLDGLVEIEAELKAFVDPYTLSLQRCSVLTEPFL